MTGLIILDVVIGLVFVFLLLSLFGTITNEWIAQWTSLRAKTLRRGLSELFGDTRLQQILTASDARKAWRDAKAKIADAGTRRNIEADLGRLRAFTNAFYRHPLIDSLKKGLSEPSYISSEAFARTVIDLMRNMVARGGTGGATPAGTGAAAPDEALPSTEEILNGFRVFNTEALEALERLRARNLLSERDAARIAEVLDGSYLTRIATTLMQGAKAEIGELEQRLGKWFDEGMERVSGWYKRYLQYIGFAVGFALALAVNADAINMASVLANEPAMRAAVVQSAGEIARTCKSKDDCPGLDFAASLRDRSGLLPIGWQKRYLPFYCYADGKEVGCGGFARIGPTLLWLLGLLATALAITLGAPFWFDLLKNLVNIRTSGLLPGLRRNR